MKYFLDTEFHEHSYNLITAGKTPTIDLISLGIVSENGKELYRISKDFEVEEAWENEWLRQNVLKLIFDELVGTAANCFDFTLEDFTFLIKKYGVSNEQIAKDVLDFIGKDKEPQFYAYYADYDWVVFCWLFGRMIDLPKHFPMYCRDLKQIMSMLNFDKDWIKQEVPQENEHNALADAKWNKKLFEVMNNKFLTAKTVVSL